MKKPWLVALIVILVLALAGIIVKAKFFSKPGPGALQISSEPRSTVFLNGSQVGITPYYDDKLPIGQYLVRLVPEPSGEEINPWESQIDVSPNILTVINRSLTREESASSGEILTLEKFGSKDLSSLAVVSVPDKAVVKIDGEPKGFSPVIVELAPGAHQVTVSAPGYKERVISANTVAGYKLTANVKLSQVVESLAPSDDEVQGESDQETEETDEKDQESAKATATPSPNTTPKATMTPPAKPYVVIKETPTGWLRVRASPSTTAEELAKVDSGEMFPYLKKEENGWYQIEYEDDKEGWISGTYAELVN